MAKTGFSHEVAHIVASIGIREQQSLKQTAQMHRLICVFIFLRVEKQAFSSCGWYIYIYIFFFFLRTCVKITRILTVAGWKQQKVNNYGLPDSSLGKNLGAKNYYTFLWYSPWEKWPLHCVVCDASNTYTQPLWRARCGSLSEVSSTSHYSVSEQQEVPLWDKDLFSWDGSFIVCGVQIDF